MQWLIDCLLQSEPRCYVTSSFAKTAETSSRVDLLHRLEWEGGSDRNRIQRQMRQNLQI